MCIRTFGLYTRLEEAREDVMAAAHIEDGAGGQEFPHVEVIDRRHMEPAAGRCDLEEVAKQQVPRLPRNWVEPGEKGQQLNETRPPQPSN